MKADLDENGVMRITPETPMEAFALKHWANAAWVMMDDIVRMEQGHWRGSMLLTEPMKPGMIAFGLPEIPIPSPGRAR